jgi:hypothetical protein
MGGTTFATTGRGFGNYTFAAELKNNFIMKAIEKNVMSSEELDEKLDLISNDLLFHPHPVIESLWLEHEEACEILGVKSRTLRWYAQRGLIKRAYVERRPVYPLVGADLLMRWILMRRAARMVA